MKSCALRMMFATWAAVAVAVGFTWVALSILDSPNELLHAAAPDSVAATFFAASAVTFICGTLTTTLVWRFRQARRAHRDKRR